MVSAQFGSKGERGSVMVEFAFLASLLLLILFGIIQFGLVFNVQLSLNYAAREGVRLAALPSPQTDAQIKSSIMASVPSYIAITADNISITPAIRPRGQPVTLTITYPYAVPVTMGVLPDRYNLRAQAVMMAGI